MGVPIEELQRLGIKLFGADGAAVAAREVVPIFHRWIQTSAVADQMLIDVADYSHVPDGPGIVLVAHEGNFSLDFAHGSVGLTYFSQAAVAGDVRRPAARGRPHRRGGVSSPRRRSGHRRPSAFSRRPARRALQRPAHRPE
jgi:hypothetical protein